MTIELQNEILRVDLIDLLCGAKLGSGCYRDVFECRLKPGYVVKIQREGNDHNQMEYEVWQRVMYTEHSKWFAQVEQISGNGKILIMERTYRPGLNEWPEKIPDFMIDLKPGNFGMSMLQDPKTGKPYNRFVAHDYGCHLLMEKGMTKRMRKVDWSQHEDQR